MARKAEQIGRSEQAERKKRARRAIAALLRRVRQVCGRIQDLDRAGGEIDDIVGGIRAFLEDDQLGSLVPQYERERLLETAQRFEQVYSRLHQASEICHNLQDALELAERAIPVARGMGLSGRLFLGIGLVGAIAVVVVAAMFQLWSPSENGGGRLEPDGAPPVARVDFGADANILSPESGASCTSLWWETEYVQAVFFQGTETGASGSEEVCPGETTTFLLEVVDLNGEKQEYTQTIVVIQDSDPPRITITITPPNPTPNDRVRIGVAAEDPGSGVEVVEIYLFGDLVEHCEGPECAAVVGPFPPGPVEVMAVVFDHGGNEGASEVIVEVGR